MELLNRPLDLGQSFFLFGPLGTGKTTWLRQRFPDTLYLDLLDASLHTELLAHPDRLRDLIPPRNLGWIVIDEVRRIPEVLNEVQRLVLTGSSARSLRRKGTNLLSGRALTFHMHPLTTLELGTAADLDRSLVAGGSPGSERTGSARVPQILRADAPARGGAAGTAGQEHGLILPVPGGGIFLVGRTAQRGRHGVGVLGRTKDSRRVLRDPQRPAARSHLSVFNRRVKRHLAAHPKFYFFDAGVYRAVRPAGPLDRPEEIEGACLETLVYEEFSALNEHLGLGCTLSYWRTAAGAEVDLVLHGPRGIVAIEGKRTQRFSSIDLAGLAQFHSDYPLARCILLAGVPRRGCRAGLEIIPLEQGLLTLHDLIAGSGSSPGSRLASSQKQW